MHRKLFILGLVLAFSCGATRAAVATAASPEPLAVAVFDFSATDVRLKEIGAQTGALLGAQFSQSEKLLVVERQELDKLVGEQELGASGLVNPATAAKIGQLTGARVLVTGRVFAVGKETMLTAKVMGVETGRVYGETETVAADGLAAEPVRRLGVKLTQLLASKADTLVAQIPTHAERVALLKQRVAGRALPKVAVHIPEQHIGRRVVDPAAQTEIEMILGEIGCVVIAADSATPADVQIRGEALSESALQRGNFFSCRARVEVQVVDAAGRVLRSDRQTEVAVDTADTIAGKLALQHAGAALADRIVDALLAR